MSTQEANYHPVIVLRSSRPLIISYQVMTIQIRDRLDLIVLNESGHIFKDCIDQCPKQKL